MAGGCGSECLEGHSSRACGKAFDFDQSFKRARRRGWGLTAKESEGNVQALLFDQNHFQKIAEFVEGNIYRRPIVFGVENPMVSCRFSLE